MGISFFALIFVAAAVIGIGFGLLWLLSLAINTLTGRREASPAQDVGASSGLNSALGISVGLVALLLVVGALFFVRVGLATQTATVEQRVTLMKSTAVYKNSKRQLIFASSNKTDGPAKPAIDVGVEVKDGSTVSVLVDMSAKPTSQSNQPQNTSSAEAEATAAESIAAKTNVADTAAASTENAERRNVQLQEMVASIGDFLRSQLEKVGDKSTATTFGQAAKSDNGDVVIFQPSDEMVRQLLGAGGEDLLKSFNSELPGRIRQTYALIPLTPPVGTTVPMQPLIANRGLEMLANSIVSLVGRSDSAASSATPEATGLTAEADGTLTVAPELRPEPEWMSKTEGRRLIAKSEPVFPGDDAKLKLTAAINKALAKHVEAVAASMDPAMLGHVKFVHMELPQAIASKYIVDQYERPETMDSEVGGKTPFKLLYALVEFPDTIDQVAVRQIRYAMQKDRIIGLGVVIGLIWTSIFSAGFGIRQWQKGTRLRKIAATPVFALITIPTLLLTVAMVFALEKGKVPQGPWNETPVTIDLANM